MSMSPFQQELANLIIDSLVLDDITVDDIDPKEPLFNDGLGLDSIDALEISFALNKAYGVTIRSDDQNNSQIFASLENLSAYVEANRTN